MIKKCKLLKYYRLSVKISLLHHFDPTQRSLNHIIHVIILVLYQTPAKDDILFLFSLFSIPGIQLLILLIIYRIIRFLAQLPISRVFFCHVSHLLFAGFKMLMFNTAGIWCFPIRLIHHRHALMVFFFQSFCFKTQTAIFQCS